MVVKPLGSSLQAHRTPIASAYVVRARLTSVDAVSSHTAWSHNDATPKTCGESNSPHVFRVHARYPKSLKTKWCSRCRVPRAVHGRLLADDSALSGSWVCCSSTTRAMTAVMGGLIEDSGNQAQPEKKAAQKSGGVLPPEANTVRMGAAWHIACGCESRAVISGGNPSYVSPRRKPGDETVSSSWRRTTEVKRVMSS